MTDNVGVFHGRLGSLKFLADNWEDGVEGVDGCACGGNGYLNRNGDVITDAWLSLANSVGRHEYHAQERDAN